MPINKIVLSLQFKKSFRKLPPDIQKQTVKKKKIFQINPFAKSLKTHKLKGKLKNRWSFSVTYSHRILFNFTGKDKVVFYDIGNHKIYQ